MNELQNNIETVLQELQSRRWSLIDKLAYRAERILDGEQGLQKEQTSMRNERDEIEIAMRVLEGLQETK